jgi:hypothetical protein
VKGTILDILTRQPSALVTLEDKYREPNMASNTLVFLGIMTAEDFTQRCMPELRRLAVRDHILHAFWTYQGFAVCFASDEIATLVRLGYTGDTLVRENLILPNLDPMVALGD